MKKRIEAFPPNRLTAPSRSAFDAAMRSALQPFDTAVARIETLWGSVDRLMRHASPETAAKFGRAWYTFEEKFDQANQGKIEADDFARYAGAIVRGLAAMEAEAGDPKPQRFMSYVGPDGRVLIIAEKEDDGVLLARDHPGAIVFSIPEIDRVLRQYDRTTLETLLEAKRLFPGAGVIGGVSLPPSRGNEYPENALPF